VVSVGMVHLDAREAKEMTSALTRMRLSMQANVTSAFEASAVLENDGDSLDDAIGTHKDEVKGALKRTSLHLAQLQMVMHREKIYLWISLFFFHVVVVHIIYKRFRIHYFISVLKRLVPTSPPINVTLINGTSDATISSIINESRDLGSTYEANIKIDDKLDKTIEHISATSEDFTEVSIESNLFDPIVSEQVFSEPIFQEVSHPFDINQPLGTNQIEEDVSFHIIINDANTDNDLFADNYETIQHIEEGVDIAGAIHENTEDRTEIDGIVEGNVWK